LTGDRRTIDGRQSADVFYRMLRQLIDIQPQEVRVVGWCWLYIFSVLASYYMIRSIRDQMGVAGGVNNLQWLFTASLVGMLNLPFAWLVGKLPAGRFIPITYRFFAVNILVFAIVLRWSSAETEIWIGRVFFVWLSTFNLFVISVVWQMNVDLFSPEEGRRLFGVIGAGATLGAIVGSGVSAAMARYVPPSILMLGSAALLGVQCRTPVAAVADPAPPAGGRSSGR
jgi:AAA family ATP:ADP antiporter